MVKGITSSLLTIAITAIVLSALGCSNDEPAVYEEGEKWPGGKTSVTVSGKSSFSRASANMQANRRLDLVSVMASLKMIGWRLLNPTLSAMV